MLLDYKSIYYMNDFNSFKNIQIKKYCEKKRSSNNRLSSPEMDMIIDVIKDYWCDLLATGYLNSKSELEKEEIFDSVTIIFPYTSIPEEWIDGVIHVDFKSFLD